MGSKNYTDAKKIEVVTSYLALGKAPLVEAVTGVPRQTIRQWKMQPWWKDLESEIRQDEDTELDSKLSKIIDRTLDTVVDRLEHGDFLLDSRTGTIKRVPVKMRDAHRVATDIIDKRNLIRGKPTSITHKVTVEDAMLKLANEFKEWASLIRKPVTLDVQDVEIVEATDSAVHEEREARLQDGIQEISGTFGSDKEAGGAEQSSQDDGSISR